VDNSADVEMKKMRSLHKTISSPNNPSSTVSSAMLHVSGSPLIAPLNHGTGYLSVMLSVTEAKLALLAMGDGEEGSRQTASQLLGPVSSLVIDDLV
jgi:hypothetical protein